MRKLLASIVVFFLAFFALSVTNTQAAKLFSDQKGTYVIASNEIVNDDVFVNATTAEINGIVNGDVFIGAQTVRIAGTVNGNLHIGAQTIDISGIVKGNTYIGAQNISITGANIGGSLLVGSQNLTIDKTTVIGGSLLTGAASANIDSQIKRNAFIGAGVLTIGDNAKIGKDLYYGAGENQASVSQKAVISGTVHKAEAKTQTAQKDLKAVQSSAPKVFGAIATAVSLGAFLSSLLVAFLYYKLFGKHFMSTSNAVSTSFWKSLGIGFLITIALIPGLIILLITIIGIPVAGLSFLIFLIFSYLSKIVVGSALGGWLVKKINWKTSAYGACALGLLAIFILKGIPFLGGFVGFVVFLAGLGALTTVTFSGRSQSK